jgi:RNA polymerase sigma-70 factor (ECF subfamily)
MAIGSLPLQEQTVILLFYMEDKSIKEIEMITGMPSGTIRSHLSRGRRHLKEYLETL